MRIRSICVAMTFIALAACGDTGDEASVDPSKVQRVDGPATENGSLLPDRAVPFERSVLAATTLDGAVVFGTAEGIFRAKPDGTFSSIPFYEKEGAPAIAPKVVALARRGKGILALTDKGLFHDAPGALVLSPLQANLAALGVKTLDVSGETLWLAASKGAYRVRGGQLERLVVPGVEGEPDMVVGLRDDAAIVVAGGRARLVEIATGVVSDLGETGRSFGSDRADDGTAYLATEQGLYACKSDLTCVRRTFAPADAPPAAVRAVSAAFGTVAVVVGDKLVEVDDASSRTLARAPAEAHALVIDASGEAWIAGAAVSRFTVGTPATFAHDVKPFFETHCTKCHTSGANGAPKIDFTDYNRVVPMAGLVVKRLRADGAPPMPPASSERLVPADYEAVVRWAATGTKP
jgi:cytochrome c5